MTTHTSPRSDGRGTGLLHRAVIAAVLLVGTMFGPGAASPWDGKEVMRDGVPHIENPNSPTEEPVVLSPGVAWQVSGDEDSDFLFGVLSQITCDNAGNVYLLDAQLNVVMVFSPDGEYVRSIGREGEGPGEFRRATDLFLTADGNVAVMQRMPGKIILLTPDGDPAGELPVPQTEDGGMQMFSEGYLAGDHVVIQTNRFVRHDDAFEVTTSLVAVDAEGDKTAEYLTRSQKNDFANMTFDERTGFQALVWTAGNDGRVYTSDTFDAYEFTIWNPDGTVDRVVEREYQPRKRSEADMKRNTPRVMIRRDNQALSPEVKVSETDRDIQQFFPREDGSLWVLSSHGAFDVPDDVVATFDVFDKEGRFVREVTIKGKGDYTQDGLHIVGDRLFVLTDLRAARRAMFGRGEDDVDADTDVEPMGVICYDLGPTLQTMK